MQESVHLHVSPSRQSTVTYCYYESGVVVLYRMQLVLVYRWIWHVIGAHRSTLAYILKTSHCDDVVNDVRSTEIR